MFMLLLKYVEKTHTDGENIKVAVLTRALKQNMHEGRCMCWCVCTRNGRVTRKWSKLLHFVLFSGSTDESTSYIHLYSLASSVIAETFNVVIWLPRRLLCTPCFTFPMFESMVGRSVESGCNDVRSAGRQRMCWRCRTRLLQAAADGDFAYDPRIDYKVKTVTPPSQELPKTW